MRLNNFVTLIFMIHEIHELKHFKLDQSNITTFQALGEFGNLVHVFFFRLAGSFLRNSYTFSPN